MSFELRLYCDGGRSCPLAGGGHYRWAGSSTIAMMEKAKSHGWIETIAGRHYCPACVKRIYRRTLRRKH